jgi:acetoin utilization protein AcuC
MAAPIILVYTDDLLKYDFGLGHSLRQIRIKLARDLMEMVGLLEDGVEERRPDEGASDEQILSVHAKSYIEAVKKLSAPGAEGRAPEFGLGTADNPIFEYMYERSAIHVAATLLACENAWAGGMSFSPGGGFHHATRSKASGFCILNDIAVGIQWLLDQGADRVLYADIDAHHGDGVQEIFYFTDKVLTLSFHEDGRFLFPGTGFPEEVGEGEGEGFAVNVPMPPYTDDASYLYAFQQIFPPLMRAYKPDVLITQMGGDSYHTDPLTHLSLTTRAYEEIAASYRNLSEEVCGGRWAALGGGGYDVTAVPRLWTLEFAAMQARTIDNDLPMRWVEECHRLSGERPGIRRISDGTLSGSPSDAVEAIVERVKAAVFPYHGLA